MPNHCFNRVNIYCDKPEVIKEIHDIFEIGTNPKVDKTVFGQIIPEPDWKVTPNDKGELPIQPEPDSMFPPKFPDGTVDDRWYNWRVYNWGTKWDCYDLSIDEDEQELTLSFNTAWSPPEDICRALKEKYEDASISWFYDEPGMEVAGYL